MFDHKFQESLDHLDQENLDNLYHDACSIGSRGLDHDFWSPGLRETWSPGSRSLIWLTKRLCDGNVGEDWDQRYDDQCRAEVRDHSWEGNLLAGVRVVRAERWHDEWRQASLDVSSQNETVNEEIISNVNIDI